MIGLLIHIIKLLKSIQRKLDALLNASETVSQEQLAKLTQESSELNSASDALTKSVEQQKG
jgi:uncharacterized protein YoxC